LNNKLVPNLQQKFLRGVDPNAVQARLGDEGGRDNIPDHFHSVSGTAYDVTFGIDSIN
jgi:hypothetical protein